MQENTYSRRSKPLLSTFPGIAILCLKSHTTTNHINVHTYIVFTLWYSKCVFKYTEYLLETTVRFSVYYSYRDVSMCYFCKYIGVRICYL